MRADPDLGKTKFEEDIKAPFVTLYSFSTTRGIEDSEKLNRMKDLAKLFPDLPRKLNSYEEDERIEVVNGFCAKELVIGGAGFQIGRKPRIDSECALILWYDHEGDEEKAVVEEFSFRYGNKDGKYKQDSAYRGYHVFEILQQNLTLWVDKDSKTKTAFFYESA
jgi:hypothetical protein